MERRAPIPGLAAQMEARLAKPIQRRAEVAGTDHVISTGSTLLDLAISGSRFKEGGIPGGILVEIFGPASAGKTVMLCELAGGVQRQGGEVLFKDPEARLNGQFASMFGFKIENSDYGQPNTVVELFEPIRKWQPKNTKLINGVFADSLAALSTEMEMQDADKYGMRRAKEFSEQCRLVCRTITQTNILMVCSNQVRQNIDVNPFAEKYSTPGGMSIGFYSSLRLRCHSPRKIPVEKDFGKGKIKRVVGVETTVEVYKSSVDVPFRTAPVRIVFDYGVDDVTPNLMFVKEMTGSTTYMLDERKLGVSLDRAVKIIEQDGLELELKAKVIQLWNEIEEKFKSGRGMKKRG